MRRIIAGIAVVAVAAAWTLSRPTPAASEDGDGDTGIADFLELLANWGPCP